MSEINERQIEMIKHSIGWNVTPPKNKRLKAYRNRYCVCKTNEDYKEWCDLVNKRFAKEYFVDEKMSLFCVTTKAIQFLSNRFKVKIIQDEEDIIEVEE